MKITDINISEFKNDYISLSVNDTAKKYMADRKSVRKWAKLLEITINKASKIYGSIDIEKFKEDYFIYSNKDLAKMHNVNINTIVTWAKKLSLAKKHGLYLDYTLNNLQMDILIGSMLGDGSLSKVCSKSGGSHFYEKHCIKQEEYLRWKKDILSPISSSEVKYERVPGIIVLKNKKLIQDSNHFFESCSLETKATYQLKNIEKEWYLRDEYGNYILNHNGWRIKKIPNNLILTPLMLFVWYLDDGYNIPSSRSVSICSQSFTKQEHDYLIHQLKLLGFNFYKAKSKNNQYILRIRTYDYIKFIKLIESFQPPQCMRYKCSLSDYMVPSISKPHNPDRITGICPYDRSNKWVAYINGIYLGVFYEKEIAIKVRKEAENIRKQGVTDPQIYKNIKNQFKY